MSKMQGEDPSLAAIAKVELDEQFYRGFAVVFGERLPALAADINTTLDRELDPYNPNALIAAQPNRYRGAALELVVHACGNTALSAAQTELSPDHVALFAKHRDHVYWDDPDGSWHTEAPVDDESFRDYILDKMRRNAELGASRLLLSLHSAARFGRRTSLFAEGRLAGALKRSRAMVLRLAHMHDVVEKWTLERITWRRRGITVHNRNNVRDIMDGKIGIKRRHLKLVGKPPHERFGFRNLPVWPRTARLDTPATRCPIATQKIAPPARESDRTDEPRIQVIIMNQLWDILTDAYIRIMDDQLVPHRRSFRERLHDAAIDIRDSGLWRW